MKKLIFYFISIAVFAGCEKVLIEKEIADDPVTNFEYLWKTVDEKYSFFEYKGIDWDQVYNSYRPLITPDLNRAQLFSVLKNMLNELKDGHVNLSASFDVSRYDFKFNAPENFNFRLLQDHYIGWNYRITGPLINTIIVRDDRKIGYIRYASFSQTVQSADIDFVIAHLWNTDGIILDMRSNGGGTVNNIYRLGGRFADEERFIYSSILKNGPGHEDFSEPANVNMDPLGARQYTRPVMLLTNRGCYSATSFFALAMKAFPHVTQVGDTTGGGLGAPAGFELPNGWGFRFSVSRTFSPQGDNWENGVPPDVTVWMDPVHELNGTDDIMEKAIELITNN
ncbi:MAG: S41 family peptidase [Bacteroidales bacterium]